jgi:hypothetical protein
MDSDVDLVVVTDAREQYVSDASWLEAAVGGPAELLRTQGWGPLTERRAVLSSGLHIDFGFVPRSWASTTPIDPGTARVVQDGFVPVVDPNGVLARLLGALNAI